MSNRDLYSGSNRDRRRKQITMREKAQREEMEQFRSMSMLQKTPAPIASSSIKAELADLNARIAIIEAEIAQGIEAAPAKADKFARWLASAALGIAAFGLVAAFLAK